MPGRGGMLGPLGGGWYPSIPPGEMATAADGTHILLLLHILLECILLTSAKSLVKLTGK